jgi:predicted DNA-binding transcriptional regulator YafY
MSKKIEELIPSLIKQISNGQGVSVVEVAKQYNVSADGIKKRLREVKDKFYKKYFDYNGSSRKWQVINNQINFLQQELLKPEEAVVLTAIDRTSDRLGKSLIATHKKIVEDYTKLVKSYTFVQYQEEGMEHIFALLTHAINGKNIVQLDYPLNGELKTRQVYPYRIAYIEYCYYLICVEDDIVKSFRVSLINNPIILDKTYQYNFSNIETRLQLAMNPYVDYQEPYKYVSILVLEKIVNNFDLHPYTKAWKKLDETIIINDKKYRKFEVTTTNKDYNDIAPIIMKYMPDIIVNSPQKLIEKIQSRIQEYQDIYSSYCQTQ